ncbi:ubiquitin carboxyl-terminal hydrolase isozyme L3-like [Myotis myotis]|uniref:ubiquitin carboxyl-terminal hydrolase isozyme L3-like n=1 Tax=Myotis myotis TaxID=51298 RepID=UPI00174C290E|nr:ubiquitin carboxyl-terminal hydrolase isozyme L3-like [Myotis myotis]
MDPELLSMVPRPVCAVLLLFPITEKYEVFRTEEEEKIKSQGQDVKSSVYFMKQTISNACGTIGLIHAIANNKDKMHFESGSTLKKFLEESVSMSPEERARYLENYDAIRVTQETSAHEGQTEAPNIDEKVDLHFIALVHVDRHLYELDGRKPFPINHGKTSDEAETVALQPRGKAEGGGGGAGGRLRGSGAARHCRWKSVGAHPAAAPSQPDGNRTRTYRRYRVKGTGGR